MIVVCNAADLHGDIVAAFDQAAASSSTLTSTPAVNGYAFQTET
jgi:hypothetical protein